MNYFIAGTDTGVGKTVVSAVITQALQADYWKPVQSGIEERDTETVASLVNNGYSMFLKEAYLLKEPVSPHAAAEMEGIVIDPDQINLPEDLSENVVIEGAGGVLSPLGKNLYVIDLAARFNAEIILVSKNYLGSINHTLLSVNEIRRRGLSIKGIVFTGDSNPNTEKFILAETGLKCLLRIKTEKEITEEIISKYAVELFKQW